MVRPSSPGSGAVAPSTPFTVVCTPASPRMLKPSARPWLRVTVMPVIRAIASTTLLSGSLPASSDVTTSTIWRALRFRVIDLLTLSRRPVTTI